MVPKVMKTFMQDPTMMSVVSRVLFKTTMVSSVTQQYLAKEKVRALQRHTHTRSLIRDVPQVPNPTGCLT